MVGVLGPNECQMLGSLSFSQAWDGWRAPEVLGTQQPS